VYAICVVAGRVAPSTLKRLPLDTELSRPRVIPLVGGRTLVAAEVPRAAFGTGTRAAPRDLQWAARCAAAHHAIVQGLADRRGSTVVPLRPFTLFPNDAAAAASLTARRRPLDMAFAQVSGRGEWVVRVTRPSDDTAALSVRRNSAARAASGTAFLAARGAERRSVANRDHRLRAGVDALATGLAAVSAHVLVRPIEPGSGLIFDAACLVPTTDRRRFRDALASLSRPLRGDGCRVMVTGPWPAYSFVTLGGKHGG